MNEDTARPAAGALRARAAIGLFWGFGASMAGRVLVFVATLVLARVLAPEAFGLVAFSLAVLAYLETVADLGAGQALIHRADAAHERIFSTAFWTGVVGAAVLAAAMWLAAPAIASLGPDPDVLVWILRVLALQFVLTALGNAHHCLLRHDLAFRRLVGPELSGGLAKGALSVALAFAGLGVWSLVAGQLAGVAVRTVGLWAVTRRVPTRAFALDEVRPIVGFGLAVSAVGVLGQAIRNLDYVIVGARLGAEQLGFYLLAFRIPELAVLALFDAAWRVLFPFYSRLRDLDPGRGARAELVSGYLASLRLGALVAFPAAAGIAVLALPIVLTLYGGRWRDSAAPLAVLAVWSAFTAVAGMPGTVFKALGRSRLLLGTAAVYLVLLAPALWIGAGRGIVEVALAHLAVQLLYFGILVAVVARVLEVPALRTLGQLLPGIVVAAPVAVAVFPLSGLLPPAAAVLLGVPLGAAVAAATLRLLFPDDFAAALAQVRRVRAQPGGATTAP